MMRSSRESATDRMSRGPVGAGGLGLFMASSICLNQGAWLDSALRHMRIKAFVMLGSRLMPLERASSSRHSVNVVVVLIGTLIVTLKNAVTTEITRVSNGIASPS